MTTGTIVQCIGAVVDVEFPRDAMPHVYDALVLEHDAGNKLVEQGLTFEVAAAARRRRGAHDRDGLVRRPASAA